MPKLKTYFFISIISLIINLGAILFGLIINDSTDLSLLVFAGTGVLTAFIPFVSLIPIALLGLPIEVVAIIGVFTGVLSVWQTLIIAFIILQIAKNILWQPDV